MADLWLTPSPEYQQNMFFDPRKCLVCFRPAYCNNYGVLTCDACKMFFRRIVTESLTYECKNNNSCFQGFSEKTDGLPKCKSCRYRRCTELGMTYVIREKKKMLVELRNKKEDMISDTIVKLLCQDSQKNKTMASCFTVENPSLVEMVARVELKIYVKTKKELLRPQDWSFFALYTTVNFLLDLDFMRHLQAADKLILLRHSASKCSLFAGAMRTYREKRDRMTTVDGQDIYPDQMRNVLGLEQGADDFLNRIRSFVVGRLVELNITTEEFVLISAIVFCDPLLFWDDNASYARSIVSNQQEKYTLALFHYCSITYQQHAPTRYAELLSLCPIIQKNFEDLQYLTMVFRLAVKGTGIQFKKIVEELI